MHCGHLCVELWFHLLSDVLTTKVTFTIQHRTQRARSCHSKNCRSALCPQTYHSCKVIASTSKHSRSNNLPIQKFQASSHLGIRHRGSYAQKSEFFHLQGRFPVRRRNTHLQLWCAGRWLQPVSFNYLKFGCSSLQFCLGGTFVHQTESTGSLGRTRCPSNKRRLGSRGFRSLSLFRSLCRLIRQRTYWNDTREFRLEAGYRGP